MNFMVDVKNKRGIIAIEEGKSWKGSFVNTRGSPLQNGDTT